MNAAQAASEALLELDSITRRLRRECPWDRAQDERSIVPHTVEEAYELADAAHEGDDAKLLDELGDVLFQVYFLALLLEERGGGNLDQVARGVTQKLVRRHPHIFGDDANALAGLPTEARTPAQVRANWDVIKQREAPGSDPAGTARSLPALLYARKLLGRTEDTGSLPDEALAAVRERLDEAERAIGESPPADGAHHGSERLYERIGELLLAAVALARSTQVDPEIALMLAARRLEQGGAAT